MVLPEPIPEYDIGDAPVLTGEFRARGTNALTDPTLATVTVKVRTSAGVITTYTTASTPAVTRVSQGIYQIQLPKIAGPPGDWHFGFEGDGDLIDAGESRFVVKPSAFAVAPTLPANQWVSGQSLLSDPRLDQAAMPPDVSLDACAQSATEYLYKRTGRRFRSRVVTVRPNTANHCGCSINECWSSTELDLPGPVDPNSIVVTIDGATMASTSYALYDGHLLVRTDGGYWPWCSHLSAPTGWSITFATGEAPGMDGILACRELAIHVALALSGKPSKIPARATGVQRRGQSMNLLRGLQSTGIPLVDDYVRSTNPHGLTGRGSVMSPDTIRLSSSGSVATATIYDGGGA